MYYDQQLCDFNLHEIQNTILLVYYGVYQISASISNFLIALRLLIPHRKDIINKAGASVNCHTLCEFHNLVAIISMRNDFFLFGNQVSLKLMFIFYNILFTLLHFTTQIYCRWAVMSIVIRTNALILYRDIVCADFD